MVPGCWRRMKTVCPVCQQAYAGRKLQLGAAMRCAICRTSFDVASPPDEQTDGEQSDDVARVVYTVLPLLVLVGILTTGLKASVLHSRRTARETRMVESGAATPKVRSPAAGAFGQSTSPTQPQSQQPSQQQPAESSAQRAPASVPALPPTMQSQRGADTLSEAQSKQARVLQRSRAVNVRINWVDDAAPAPVRQSGSGMRSALFGAGEMPAQFQQLGDRLAGLQAVPHKLTLTMFPGETRQTLVDATDLYLTAFTHRTAEDARAAAGKFRSTTLVGTTDGVLYQWDRGRRTTLTGQHDAAVKAVWYRRADVLSVSSEGGVLVHSDPAAVPQPVLLSQPSAIVCAAADAPLIGRADQTVVLLDFVPAREAAGFRFAKRVSALATSWRMLAVGGQDRVEIRDRLSLERVRELHVPGSDILAIAISDDERLLAVGGALFDVKLFSLETGQMIQRWALAERPGSLAFTTDNLIIVENAADRFETLTPDAAAVSGARTP